jgi:tetratricopeptide (TPR) repeat protein
LLHVARERVKDSGEAREGIGLIRAGGDLVRPRLASLEETQQGLGAPDIASKDHFVDYIEPHVASPGSTTISRRQLLERYKHVREDHLRYMQKWGLIRADRSQGEPHYTFSDLAVIRQADVELAAGHTLRAVLRSLIASNAGQLAFDFRIEAHPAKVLQLKRPEPPPLAALMDSARMPDTSSVEQLFLAASMLDDGDPSNFEEALAGYRRALEIDPYMVPALINLANIHYARDEIAEAQALYERAIVLDSDVFEAHFNLGNIFHDLGRYVQAQGCYRDALKLNPTYADTHFYLAVTLEKSGQSADARPHWRAYQQLAPNGEWVSLAKEFSD